MGKIVKNWGSTRTWLTVDEVRALPGGIKAWMERALAQTHVRKEVSLGDRVYGMSFCNRARRTKYLAKKEFERLEIRFTEIANAEPHFTWREWERLIEKFNSRCVRCGIQLSAYRLTDDHIVPIMRGGFSTIDNIQPMCLPCNVKKGVKTTDYRQDFFIRFPQYA